MQISDLQMRYKAIRYMVLLFHLQYIVRGLVRRRRTST